MSPSRAVRIPSSPHLAPGRAKVGLALSGGGSLGAFSAGLLHEVMCACLDDGRLPRVSVVAGTSTGALVAGLVAELYGRFREGSDPREALRKLERFYTTVDQDDVARLPAHLPGRLWNLAVRGGMADISPLARLVDAGYAERFVRGALSGDDPCLYVVTCVDMVSGRTVAFRTDRDDDLARMKDAIFASCAQPVVMTPAYVTIDGAKRWATDGGVREVIPLREPMRAGCTHVLAVALNEPSLDADHAMSATGERDVFERIARGLSVMNDEVARDDERLARMCAYVNRARDALCAAGVDPRVVEAAFDGGPLPDVAPDADDPSDDGVYNASRLRELLLFRFAPQDLPDAMRFDPRAMRRLWDQGVELARRQKDDIRAFLFSAGTFLEPESRPPPDAIPASWMPPCPPAASA